MFASTFTPTLALMFMHMHMHMHMHAHTHTHPCSRTHPPSCTCPCRPPLSLSLILLLTPTPFSSFPTLLFYSPLLLSSSTLLFYSPLLLSSTKLLSYYSTTIVPEHALDGTGLLRMPREEASAPKASPIYVLLLSYHSLICAYILVSYLSHIRIRPRGGIRELSPCRGERGLPHEGLLVARAAHRYGREG